MAADLEDLLRRLEAVAEELSDLALDRLRAAAAGGPAALVAEERRMTRARRAVERAIAILSERAGDPEDSP
jgi:hypothetical protein